VRSCAVFWEKERDHKGLSRFPGGIV